MNDTLTRAIAAAESNARTTGRPLDDLRGRRKQLHGSLTMALEDGTPLKASEQRSFDVTFAHGKTVLAQLDERIAELEGAEERSAASGAAYQATGIDSNVSFAGLQSWHHTGGGVTYSAAPHSPSFFRDLRNAQRGDAGAIERLARNNHEVDIESRAIGNTGGTGGSAGEMAPPGWLTSEFVRLARPGRVTADLFHHEPLPSGVSSISLPRITGGTATAVQTTQNTTLPAVDMTTAALTSTITTIGGKQIVSQQLLDQSAVPIDKVVLEDLAADYSKQIGTQALTGSGASGQLKGYLTATSTNVVTWTQAAPTAAGFYSQLAKLQGQINATRFAPPDTVVMHPRRWAWFASFTDSTGRPLIVPESGGFNSMANPGPNQAAGLVGSVLGMACYTDPNIAVNLGAGTNQDTVLMFPKDDVWLWESNLRAESFTAPYSESLGVLFRVFSYSALIPDRYAASLGQISGTGLITPVFAS